MSKWLTILVLWLAAAAGSPAAWAQATYFQGRSGTSTSGTCAALGGDVTGTCALSTVGKIGGVAASLGGALTTGGALTLSGAFGFTGTLTGTTAVTFPTSGTLATTAGSVASFSAGTTGLTPSSTTTGAVTLAGTLAVANGGTNSGTASGTALDNITGFSSTGFLLRTGAGAYGFQSATNGITLGNIAQIGTNTILANGTNATANVAAMSVGGCSAAGSALNWTTNTGIGCNTTITAASVPASGLTGSTLASGVTASSLTSFGANPTLGAATGTSLALGGGSAITSSGAGGALGTAAFVNTGTSGATVPLLNLSTTVGGNWDFAANTSFGATGGSAGEAIFYGSTSGDWVLYTNATGAPLVTNLANSTGTDPMCWNSGTGAWEYATACTVSDAGLKTTLTALTSTDVLGGLMAMHPGTGRWLDATENAKKGEQAFLTAQDVRAAGQAFPRSGLGDLVFPAGETRTITLSDGSTKTVQNPLGLDYAKGFVFNIAAEQAMEKQISDLAAKLSAQQRLILSLQTALARQSK